MRLGDQRDLAKVKPPSELHQIGRREFVFKGGLTALALLLGGKFFSNRLGRATPLVEPETDGVTSSGEPQVEILQNISERQENDHDLAELAAKNPLMRQDILEYLGISFIIKENNKIMSVIKICFTVLGHIQNITCYFFNVWLMIQLLPF